MYFGYVANDIEKIKAWSMPEHKATVTSSLLATMTPFYSEFCNNH